MARPLRIEYPGAWYHVMNRGRHREDVFANEKDYRAFIGILRESTELLKVRIAAFCLMSNHYHLLIQTPLGNLSRCMKRIDGVYAQRYNRRYARDGQLFKGRYKSILVEAEAYLLHLVRYIHLNPLEAGLVSTLGDYEWSSHRGYLSSEQKWGWLNKGHVLSMIGGSSRNPLRSYMAFMREDNPREITDFYSRKDLSPILGRVGFIEWVKEQFSEEKSHVEVPESEILVPSFEKIVRIVSGAYGVQAGTLLVSRRGRPNEARSVAIYLTTKLAAEKLGSVAGRFGLSRHTSVCSVVNRMDVLLRQEPRLKEFVDGLEKQIKMRQETT